MPVLYTVNPRKRRKGRKHRSAAQRAATARLVAMNRSRKMHRNPRGKSRRRQRGYAVAASPRVHRKIRRFVRRSRRTFRALHRRYSGGMMGSAVGILKAGAIGGIGAVSVDILMSYTKPFLPASMQSPVNPDSSANFGYFGAKAALAVALGTFGRRLPVVGRFAGQMAEGAMTVLAYQLIRPMVPATMLGYMNPAPTVRGTGAYVSGGGSAGQPRIGAYASVPVRSGAQSGSGARASQVLSMVTRRRMPA
jgi:hypothetical protein